MGGGTLAHAALQAQVIAALVAQLRTDPCRVFTSELRVHVVAADVATYPDVTVICGPRAIDPADRNAVVDATALVEVLSPSTEEYDRGAKFDAFKKLPSLRHYVLVAPHERRVEVWTRDGSDGWVRYDGAAPPERVE